MPKEFVIRNAEQYADTLARTHTPVGRTVYGALWQAVRDIARVACMPADKAHVAPGGDGETWYVYRSEEDAEGDDGSNALAIIATKESFDREQVGDEE